jgi:hypothetical protein
MIPILLLLLALGGGAEEPPTAAWEVVTSDGNAVPPNSCLPRPSAFGWRAFNEAA